jgi:hypothetical protein
MNFRNMLKGNLVVSILSLALIAVAGMWLMTLVQQPTLKAEARVAGYTALAHTQNAVEAAQTYLGAKTGEVIQNNSCDFDYSSGSFLAARPAMKQLAENIAEGKPALMNIEPDQMAALTVAMTERHLKDKSMGCRYQDVKAAVYRFFH